VTHLFEKFCNLLEDALLREYKLRYIYVCIYIYINICVYIYIYIYSVTFKILFE